MKVTLNLLAQSFGRRDSEDTSASLAHHQYYVAADTETQKAMRVLFMVNFIMAHQAVSEKKATEILDTPRTERSDKHQTACDSAKHSFARRIVRKVSGGSASSVDLVEQAMRIVGKMTAAQKRKLAKLMAE